ncbi:MAG: PQQ-binding-like beta-propeller repeat protein [Planctomycetales bacterium]|nr:PQQ-binding-like beta-propeller repeat protein [Planctomycetales bacterium]
MLLARNWWIVSGCFCLFILGCRRSNPIAPITLDSSGVEVRTGQVDFTNTWPAWRGPGNDGLAPEQAIAIHWDASQNVLWKSQLPGRGHGSPIVFGNLVFLLTADEQKKKQSVLALDKLSGQLTWETVVHDSGWVDQSRIHPKGSYANSTLACDGVHIYAATYSADQIFLTALDLQGEQVWQTALGPFDSKFGFAPSPILYKSLVILACDHQGSGYLVACDNQSGKIAWRTPRPAMNSHSTACVASVGGRDQLLVAGCRKVASYDPVSGKENWQVSGTGETTCGTVVTDGERIVASGGYPEKETLCLDPNGQTVWKIKTSIYEPSPIIVGDYVYGISDNGIAYCWDLSTGEQKWQERLGGSFSASPVAVGEKIIVTNLDGKTFVFQARSERFESLAENVLGSDCYASPAVCEGRIYLRVGVGKGPNRHEELVCIAPPNS